MAEHESYIKSRPCGEVILRIGDIQQPVNLGDQVDFVCECVFCSGERGDCKKGVFPV